MLTTWPQGLPLINILTIYSVIDCKNGPMSRRQLSKRGGSSTSRTYTVKLIVVGDSDNLSRLKTNQQNDCVPSQDSDQPGLPSLIRVFAVRSMGT